MSPSNVKTRWVKFGNSKDLIVLFDDVIAIASGINVMFLNLSTGEERIEKFDSPERGRGASCLAGHPAVSMFATAERRYHPKIFIFTYPGIRKVSNCSLECGPNGYLSSIFAGTEYLLTITSFPDFQIILWLWRTGECLTSIDTTITDQYQRISCSPSSPYQVSQLGETTGNLVVYEINVCSRIITISPTNENYSLTKKAACSSWTSDGNLFHCDVNGNVTLHFNDGKKRHLVVRGESNVNTNSKDNPPLIESFRSGLVLVNRESQILFYRKPIITDDRVKSESPWRLVWSIQAIPHPVSIVRSSNRDSLLFCGKGGEIFELIANDEAPSPQIRMVTNQGTRYEFLTSINPRGDHVMAIDEFDRLSIFQCATGQLVMKDLSLNIHGHVRCIASHPNLPLIAIGTAIGKLVLISLIQVSQPSIIKVIHLQRESLETIRYSWSATCLGIADNHAKLFLIDSTDNSDKERYLVMGLIHVIVDVMDFLLYENEDGRTMIMILAKIDESKKFGRKIIVCSFNNVQGQTKVECMIDMTNILNSLWYGRNDREIIVIPYLTKQLHFLKIQEDFRGISLIEALTSGHQLRNIKICMKDQLILTFGYDGLIILRNAGKSQQVLSIFMAHHRLDGGVKNAILFSNGNTIVSLGRNGDLIATKIRNIKSVVNISNLEEVTLSPVQEAKIIEDDDLTWIERNDAMNLRIKREESTAECNSILEDFSKLQERLKFLLDANESESTNSWLSISDFDLDVISRSRKINENIVNAKALETNLEKEISQRDKISGYLRELCWDSMKVHACSLLSINGKIRIDNFPIPRVTNDEENRRRWESFIVNFKSLSSKKEARQHGTDDRSIVGTTGHRFLPEMSASSRNQIRKCPSYCEAIEASIVVRDRERKLKIYFNELFTNMRSTKERELNMAAQNIEEIERYSLELKNMFGINCAKNNNLLQPLWHYSEKPETIVTISDNEILDGKAAIYLERDTRLELMRKQEEERLRLNDSFREGALEIMMDGLLEVRWEDEIKKNLPIPDCLSNKDPSTYTKEEIAECEIYRIKCEELKREREKYKKILMDKMTEVEGTLKRNVEYFDQSLETFHLDRMKIESAILQERSMRLRDSQRQELRRRGIEIMKSANDELSLAQKNHRKLCDLSIILESVVTETRNRYENLLKRDKILDSKFRGEFADLKQPMVEHLLRHYRKRPRNVQLTCTSITYLTELSKNIVSGEKSEILPGYCTDFLRGMDSLDVMPNNLPAQIDAGHWNLLCKLRRAKVELEIKIKICAVDLAESEQTFVSRQKSCTNAEARVSQLREMLKEREIQQDELLENQQVQLVLKMGQIESNLCGDPAELQNAILVPLRVVESANKAIIATGHEKLGAMRKTVVFRRTILWREWRHKCLRITLGNMTDDLKVLQSVKVTKDIQNYLLTTSGEVEATQKSKIRQRLLASTKKRFEGILKECEGECKDTIRVVELWRRKNERDAKIVERMKLASFKVSMLVHDENRERDTLYQRGKLKGIMRRTIVAKKVQNNYQELLALQTRLELLRLKTYPTLRFKGHQGHSRTLKEDRS